MTADGDRFLSDRLRLLSGQLETVDRMAKAGTPTGQPKQTILIKSIKIRNG